MFTFSARPQIFIIPKEVGRYNPVGLENKLLKKHHKFSIWYVLIAVWVVILIQNILVAAFKIEHIPYSEFIKALELMYPSFRRSDVLAFKISKASHVFPITTLNYSTELLTPIRTSLENVFLVNSAQLPNGTMNVNEIVGLANRKAVEFSTLLYQ